MTTKERILDAAERLFARDGFDATSLRAITTEAQVNLAAVNYHFQSKEALVQAVIGRRLGPINARRLALLDAYEAEAAGAPVALEKILDAFLRPVIEFCSHHAQGIVPLLGRLYTEPGDFGPRLFQQHFEHMAQRFVPALARALPDLPREELFWRMHFAIGAMAHTLAASQMLSLMSKGRCDITDVEGTLARLKSFTIGGITVGVAAPVSDEVHYVAH
jgi:AcrR family transcriptional regulator